MKKDLHENTTQDTFKFLELINPLKLEILIYLDAISLNNIRSVCQSLLILGNTESLWKRLVAEHFPNYRPSKVKHIMSSRELYKQAEIETYQSSSWLNFETVLTPFKRHEKLLFRAIKNNNMFLFNKILDDNYKTLSQLIQLFELTDQYHYSIFQWMGKFNKQAIQDLIFLKIYNLWEKEYKNDYFKVMEEYPVNIIQIASACNQVNFLKKMDETILLTSNDYFLNTPNSGPHPLMMACYFNSYEATEFLIEQGIEAKEILNDTKRNCLSVAAVCGNEKLINYLAIKNVEVDNQDNNQMTPLMYAIANDNLVAVMALIKARANINIQRDSSTCLKLAFDKMNKEVLEVLLSVEEVEVTSLIEPLLHKPYTEESILKKIFQHSSKKYLSQSGSIDFLKRDSIGNSIVHWHAFCNITDGLEEYPKNLLDLQNNKNLAPLYVAALQNNIKVTRELITLGAKNNSRNDYEETPFFLAASKGYNELVDYYLTIDTDVNLSNRHRSTPLRSACEQGHLETVRKLLAFRATNINFSNFLRVTPLTAAAEKGHAEIVAELLLQPEVDTTSKVPNGNDALAYAKQKNFTACAKLIELLGNYSDNYFSLLEHSSGKFIDHVIKYLTNKNTGLNFSKVKYHIAAKINQFGFIKLNNEPSKSDIICHNLINTLKTTEIDFDSLINLVHKTTFELIMNNCFDHNLKAIGGLLKFLNGIKKSMELKNDVDDQRVNSL